MNTVSFPNIGINDLKLDSVAFTLFGHEIAWYGIIITLAIIAAVLYSYLRLRQKGIVNDHYLDLAIATVVFGVIGTRLFYVLTNLDQYDSFWDVFKVWEGGLAIYGGIIGGCSALIIAAWIKKMYIPVVLDCVGPGVMLGQMIGRWGNFMNAEAYGSTESFVFFGKSYVLDGWKEKNPFTMVINGEIYAQPTFLYECVWNLFGFVLINIFYKKKKFDGDVALWYLGWYGFGRMFIEGLRTDSLFFGSVKASQLIGLLFFLGCLAAIIILRIKKFNVIRPLYLKDKEEDDLPDDKEDDEDGTDN
ncbi:MAG: prolipoprotein diacylglyceryl transferase [Ruminococcaceae bacterium]|nr:prolipoprotein diacylglyceryl transferase [Oscillospiraceae bacterium]